MYVSNKLNSMQIKPLSQVTNLMEILTIKCSIGDQSFIVCSIYRPDSKYNNVDKFTNELLNILNDKQLKNEDIIVIGDLNINLLEHQTHQPTNDFINAMQAMNFHPHISKPTRFPDNIQIGLPSLLDHIFTNFFTKSISGIIHYPISDHLPVFLALPIRQKLNNMYEMPVRALNERTKQDFTSRLSEIQ